MPNLSIEMSKEEYEAIQNYASAHDVSMEKAVKDAFFEMLEDQLDIEAADAAYAMYLKDPKAYTSEEVARKLGIK